MESFSFSSAWAVTGVGFMMVVGLLLLLVLVLTLFGRVVRSVSAATKPAAAAVSPRQPGEPTEDELAAIAMALKLNGQASSKPSVLTIKSKATAWSSKIFGVK